MGETSENGLLLTRCHACGHIQHSSSHTCHDCSSLDLEKVHHNGAGEVHSYVFPHPEARGELPRSPSIFAVVQLDQGPKVLGILVGVGPHPPGITLDMPVRLTTAETRGTQPLPHFRPL